MIIYNVTINVETAIHDEWLTWMKTVHIPDVMSKGLFVGSKMMKLLTTQDDETGVTYAIQYTCESIEKYELYQKEFAPALQAETQKLFAGKFVAFRTLLEEI